MIRSLLRLIFGDRKFLDLNVVYDENGSSSKVTLNCALLLSFLFVKEALAEVFVSNTTNCFVYRLNSSIEVMSNGYAA